MPSGFHDGSRSLQQRFDTQALADRIDGLLVSDTIGEGDRAFIEDRDLFFLATADAEGRPTARTRVASRASSAWWIRGPWLPNYDGNGMYLSTGNVLVNPDVGLLFIDFERGHRMRLEGTASIDFDDPLAQLPRGPVRRPGPRASGFPNCPVTSTGTSSCGARGSCRAATA